MDGCRLLQPLWEAKSLGSPVLLVLTRFSSSIRATW